MWWDHEKKVLLATAKLLMESAGGVVSNKELENISKRTAETIKKARQKADYKAINH